MKKFKFTETIIIKANSKEQAESMLWNRHQEEYRHNLVSRTDKIEEVLESEPEHDIHTIMTSGGAG